MEEKKFEGGQVDIPPIEETTEHDRAYRELIQSASDFETLYETIRQMGVIRGTAKEYEAEKLIGYIDRVRSGDMDLSYITRTYGLRDKIQELLGVKSGT